MDFVGTKERNIQGIPCHFPIQELLGLRRLKTPSYVDDFDDVTGK